VTIHEYRHEQKQSNDDITYKVAREIDWKNGDDVGAVVECRGRKKAVGAHEYGCEKQKNRLPALYDHVEVDF
jgi:hypothetical protein